MNGILIKRNDWADIKHILKLVLIFVIPIFLTLVMVKSSHTPYEFVDKDTHSMVAPALDHPYLPKLFSDLLNNLKVPWHNFCIKNNSYSIKHNTPFDLAIRLENESSFSKINFSDVKCYPILSDNIKYDVAWGGFIIPNKEWVNRNFECNNEQCSLKFKIEEMINFEVYSEFSFFMIITVYLIFLFAIVAILQTFIFVWNFIFVKK